MGEHLKKLLEKLALTPDTLKKLEENTITVDEVYSSIKADQQKLIKADPEFTAHLELKGKQEALSVVDKHIKKLFNLSAEELKDSQGIPRKTDDLMQYGVDKFTKETRAMFSEQNDEKLVAQVAESHKLLQQREEELRKLKNEDIPAITAAAQKTIEEDRTSVAFERFVETKFKLVTPVNVIAPAVLNKIKDAGLQLKREGSTLTLVNKENALPFKPDKSGYIELEDFTHDTLAEWKAIPASNAAQNTQAAANSSNSNNVQTEPKPVFTSAPTKGLLGLELAEANLRQQKTATHS